ncbi:rhodanese-like domain-containing protein [Streptomyces sp. NEAU-YJ-81]|uniref:rhodanese-like domain-containing protein n=1 Tax=Streptomyces sp. NEAU-YJ-81 TaxID=2820288 RepID=UPI001ABC1C30|nr:rhodanese-like domain-containing protein [Streptomyces sp. NEAU-YJ-81]MBO3680205.1 rhodanese-like domain-containing protein [Streptomyces sp. NEAU-YJ-81]
MFPQLHRGPVRLTPQQAHQQTSASQAVLLDVRETPEWKAGHAPGALHLPLSRLITGASLPASTQGKPVVTICRSGHRSQQAAKLLAGRGVEATDVTGGMTAWARQGLPVTGEGGSSGAIA